MSEDRETRLRRLRMRSMRRGMKEMDLILDRFARERLATLSEADVARYDALLAENDQEIFAWILGTAPAPQHYESLIAEIADSTGA